MSAALKALGPAAEPDQLGSDVGRGPHLSPFGLAMEPDQLARASGLEAAYVKAFGSNGTTCIVLQCAMTTYSVRAQCWF